jgi:MFS transporter, DHA1 family, inner membrane transport protein
MSFLAVAAIGVIAALVIIWKLPRTVKTEAEHTTLSQQIKALRHQEVWLSYVTIALTMTGTICYSTFSVPLMLEVTGIGPDIIPWVLLLGGVGSVLGIWLGGELADWKPMPSLVAVLILQSLVFFVMIFTLHDPVLMTITVFASGIVGFAFSTPLQSRIVHAAREAPNFAASLISTGFNIGIAAGAFLGAMLLNAGVSYADLPAAPVVSALLGAAAASMSWWLERRSKLAAA